VTGRVPNPDTADVVNTIQKMAQKRALVPATLLATSGSEFFTQDLEDAPEPPDTQRNTIAEQAELAQRRIKETRGEAPTQGAGDSPADPHVQPPTHPASEVPAPLKALFDNLGTPGYIKQAYSLLKNRLIAISPDGGAAEYESIIDHHKARDAKSLELHKAVLLEMWNTADEWQRQATETKEAEQGSLL